MNVTGNLPPTIALNTDFGHAAVGKLGNNKVKTSTPGQRIRRNFADLRDKAKGLGQRIAIKAQPKDNRAKAEFTTSLRNTSSEVGKLLAALTKTSTHVVDGLQAREIIRQLGDTSRPMVEQGTDYAKIIEARVRLNLGKMTLQQLLDLQAGLKIADNSPLQTDDVAGPHITLIQNELLTELKSRAVQSARTVLRPRIETACREVANEKTRPGSVQGAFTDIVTKATDVLRQHGLDDKDVNVTSQLARALIVETLTSDLASSPEAYRDIATMTSLLSSKELHTLNTVPPFTTSMNSFDFTMCVQGVIGKRMQDAEEGFLRCAEKLMNIKPPLDKAPDGPLMNPRGFAALVIETAQHLALMRDHGGRHQLPIEEVAMDALAGLMNHFNNQISLKELRLDQLNSKMLCDLGRAFKTLEIDLPPTATSAFNRENALRMDAHKQRYETCAREISQAAKSGDQKALLRSLQGMQKVLDQAVSEFRDLGHDIGGPNELLNFHGDMLSDALKLLPQDELLHFHGLLIGTEMQKLAQGLGEIGFALAEIPEETNPYAATDLKRTFVSMSSTMLVLKGVTKELLTAAGVKLPEMPESPVFLLEDMTTENREAVAEVFHLDAYTVNGQNRVIVRSGPVTQPVQNAFSEGLQVPPSIDERKVHKLLGGLDTIVSDMMWRDLPRADFRVHPRDGEPESILNRDRYHMASNTDQQQVILSGVNRLTEFVGDEDMMTFISYYAHQGIFGSIGMQLVTPDSPIKLPDGTPGQMIGGSKTTYTFSKGDDGSIVLNAEWQITNATTFLDPKTGDIKELDPTQSNARFSIQVTFTKDQRVIATKPVEFQYEIKPKEVDSNRGVGSSQTPVPNTLPIVRENVIDTPPIQQQSPPQVLRQNAPIVAQNAVWNNRTQLHPNGVCEAATTHWLAMIKQSGTTVASTLQPTDCDMLQGLFETGNDTFATLLNSNVNGIDFNIANENSRSQLKANNQLNPEMLRVQLESLQPGQFCFLHCEGNVDHAMAIYRGDNAIHFFDPNRGIWQSPVDDNGRGQLAQQIVNSSGMFRNVTSIVGRL